MLRHYSFILAACFIVLTGGCRKLIEIDPPTKTIGTEVVFNDPGKIDAVLANMYSLLMTNSGSTYFSNGATTLYCGMAADELINYSGSSVEDDYQFTTGQIAYNNGAPSLQFWTPAYKIIYSANAIIEGVKGATSQEVTDSVRNQAIGEAQVVRAFCYFYLVNIFGDVPLVTVTDFNQLTLLKRTPVAEVYAAIIKDLEDAQVKLGNDFQLTGNEKIRPGKWAATALLARVHLYLKHWKEAEELSSAVINSGLFSLTNDLDSTFLKNNKEAIWQLKQSVITAPYNGTWEAYNLVPINRYTTADPELQEILKDPYFFGQIAPFLYGNYYMSSQLVSAFEPGDKRKLKWTDSLITPTAAPYDGSIVHFAFKYKIRGNAGEAVAEYYTVFRLAEQYLIRAEARTESGNTGGAAEDIDIIRSRAGLSETTATSRDALLDAIAHERQIELFAEWGHRWFDLKRTNRATAVLRAIPYKQGWKPAQLLFPIPPEEISTDPNLVQNPGY